MEWMDDWGYWNNVDALIHIIVSFMLMFVVDNFAGFISTYVLTTLYNALSMVLHTLLTYYPVLAFTINLGIIATVNTTLIGLTKVYDALRHADDYMRMTFVIVTITITLTTSILWTLTL